MVIIWLIISGFVIHFLKKLKIGILCPFCDFLEVVNYAQKRKKKYRKDKGGIVPADQRSGPVRVMVCTFREMKSIEIARY